MSQVLPIFKSDSFQFTIDKKFKSLFVYDAHNLKEIKNLNLGTLLKNNI